jgi:hypothetical protein
MLERVRAYSTPVTSLCSPYKHQSYWVPVVSSKATRLPNQYTTALLVAWLSCSTCLIVSVSLVLNARSTLEVDFICSTSHQRLIFS